MTTRVKIQTPAKRRAVLDARRKVLDAETELANAEAGLPQEGQEGEEDATGGGDTHIHIHAGGKPSSGAETEDEDEGVPGEGGAPAGGDSDRLTALETSVAAITDTLAGLTEAVRKLAGGEAGEEDQTGDEDIAETDANDVKEATGDGENPFAKKDDEDDKTGKTMDSAALATSYAQVLAQAEVLVPGFRMPTFDAKAKRKTTVDAMCGARRKALGLSCATTDGATLVTSVNGGKEPDLDKMDCAGVANLFKAAAGAKALLNNRAGAKDSAQLPNQQHQVGTKTIADINKANADYWAKVNRKPA